MPQTSLLSINIEKNVLYVKVKCRMAHDCHYLLVCGRWFHACR